MVSRSFVAFVVVAIWLYCAMLIPTEIRRALSVVGKWFRLLFSHPKSAVSIAVVRVLEIVASDHRGNRNLVRVCLSACIHRVRAGEDIICHREWNIFCEMLHHGGASWNKR